MNIGIVGPQSHISASSKIAFNQASHLVKREHKVYFILQKRGLDLVKRLYTGLFEGVDLIELAPVPLLSPLFDRLTSRYRRMFAGAQVPITQDTWYNVFSKKYIGKYQMHKYGSDVVREADVDFGAMVLRSPSVSKLLAKKGSTALVCHATLLVISVLPMYAASRIKKILYLHDIPVAKTLVTEGRDPSSPVVEMAVKFEKWVISNSDALACSTKVHVKDWLEWYGVEPRHIPPGCTPTPHLPLHRSNYALTVTYWGPDKRPFFFLDVADLLRESDLLLVMAGHWPDLRDLQEMKKRIKQRNLETKIIVVPDPAEDELKRLYRHARCFVAAPKSGGHMMAGLEASAVGTPIIYPKVAGTWDLFTPGVHGFVANIEEIEDVVACIRKFENDELVYKMGREIWLRAKELSWEAHASAIEELLSE